MKLPQPWIMEQQNSLKTASSLWKMSPVLPLPTSLRLVLYKNMMKSLSWSMEKLWNREAMKHCFHCPANFQNYILSPWDNVSCCMKGKKGRLCLPQTVDMWIAYDDTER